MRGATPSLLRASSYCGTYTDRNRNPFIVVSTETGNKGWKNIKGNEERERKRKKEWNKIKRRRKERNFSFIVGRAKTKRTHHCSGRNCRWITRTENAAWHVRQPARMDMSSELRILLNSVKLILILCWWIWLSENEQTLYLVPVYLTLVARHNNHTQIAFKHFYHEEGGNRFLRNKVFHPKSQER